MGFYRTSSSTSTISSITNRLQSTRHYRVIERTLIRKERAFVAFLNEFRGANECRFVLTDEKIVGKRSGKEFFRVNVVDFEDNLIDDMSFVIPADQLVEKDGSNVLPKDGYIAREGDYLYLYQLTTDGLRHIIENARNDSRYLKPLSMVSKIEFRLRSEVEAESDEPEELVTPEAKDETPAETEVSAE